MILSFSQKWPKSMGQWAGQPTYFIDKIWASLMDDNFPINIGYYSDYNDLHISKFGKDMSDFDQVLISPKLHTMRHDPHDKWFAGRPIQYAINPRSKNYFRFAPVIQCVSIQTAQIIDSAYTKDNVGILIEYSHKHKHGVEEYVKFFEVIVDGVSLKSTQIEELAINDGFESVKHFFTWFKGGWKGKIIHWTNLKY